MITPQNKEKGVIHGKETFSHCVHRPKAAEGDNLSAGKVMRLATNMNEGVISTSVEHVLGSSHGKGER
jgi:hypothetical protein